MIEKFWINNADTYSEKGFEINEVGTHPHLIKLFDKYCPYAKNILDYGCGDGSLIKKLNKEVNISLFDISPQMLKIAKNSLSQFHLTVFPTIADIPDNQYDCIFLSMVLICVSTQKDVIEIIKKIRTAKTNEGYVFVANPHPCFRDKPFSSYYTEFSIGKDFNYFENGERHQIFLRETDINFFDYNWSFSFLLNSFIKQGLQVVEVAELKDNDTNSFYNAKHSPTIIYVLK